MIYKQGLYPVISKKAIAENCFDFTVYAPEIAELAQPGQFVHVKVDGFTLRRPISICGIDKANKTIRIVFEVRGAGTEKLSQISKADNLDIMGPLGKGFTILEPDKKAVVIGGGIGVPPLLEVAKQYNNPTAVIGFRSAANVILAKDFAALTNNVLLCTDDGTVGIHGFVTEALKKHLESEKPDIIYACGPHGMLKAIVDLAFKYDIRCEVSLEERMGCGVGACLVCACKTVKNGEEFYSHVCKDGPVFDSKQVVF